MHLYLFTYTLGRQLAALTRHLETGKNDIFKKSIPQERVIVDWHGVRIQNKKKIVQILNILILSGDIEPGKSSCQPKIASCLPRGKFRNNILAALDCVFSPRNLCI